MKNVAMISLVMLLALWVLAGCGNDNTTVFGSGFVEATTVLVSAQVNGVLDALYVDEGSTVARGEALGVIDTVTVVLDLRRAHAQLESARMAARIAGIDIDRAQQDEDLARKEFDRINALRKKGTATQQQYDQAENRLRQSELAVRLAKATLAARDADVTRIQSEIAILLDRLEKCRPASPVNGLVTNKLTEAGELMAPGRPIVEIARMDSMWVKVYVPAHSLTRIRIGERASVDPEDGRTTPFDGHIVWVASEAEFTPKNVQTEEARADLVYAVKVRIENETGALKIGMPVMVTFE
ncbi:MAG: efflux RND transporter periplasmic adaptor subunit [bacterium]